VANLDGQTAVREAAFTYDSGSAFIRGDADGTLTIDITDTVHILNYQFLAGTIQCLDAADADDTGSIDISDPIHLLNYMFSAGPPPPPPFPQAGVDTTADELGC